MLEQIEYIRILISKGDTEKAVDLITDLVRANYPDLRNQILVLSSRLGSENRNRRLGFDFDKQEIAKINFGILEILDDLEEEIKDKAKNIKIEIVGEDENYHKRENLLNDHRLLLEDIKNLIINCFLIAKVEIIAIRATIIDENFQFWEARVENESNSLSENEVVLSKIFYQFYLCELNVLNFSWGPDLISLNIYIKNGEIGFFEMRKQNAHN